MTGVDLEAAQMVAVNSGDIRDVMEGLINEVDEHRERARFDYMAEADKTCSIVYNPQYVPRDDFVTVLNAIAGACRDLNIYKKLLFRGKRPEDLSLLQPLQSRSLAVEFDPNNPLGGEVDLLHGLVGAITEAGEMAEVLINRLNDGKFDCVNALEEAGDVSWYLVRMLRGLGVDMAFMHRANINKLHGRHGETFDVFRDANRDLASERAQLEADAMPLLEGRELDWSQRGYSSAEEAAAIDKDIKDLDRPCGFDPAGRAGYEARDRAEETAEFDSGDGLPALQYGDCMGDSPHAAPKPGLVWHNGCWRRQFVRDDTGLAV